VVWEGVGGVVKGKGRGSKKVINISLPSSMPMRSNAHSPAAPLAVFESTLNSPVPPSKSGSPATFCASRRCSLESRTDPAWDLPPNSGVTS
jgi:hypothetical protein